MRMSKIRSAMWGLVAYALSYLPMFSVVGSVSGSGRSWVASALRHVIEKDDFPATSKLRFELTLAQWRNDSGVGEGISAGGLLKSSHHFMQIGSQEAPALDRMAVA